MRVRGWYLPACIRSRRRTEGAPSVDAGAVSLTLGPSRASRPMPRPLDFLVAIDQDCPLFRPHCRPWHPIMDHMDAHGPSSAAEPPGAPCTPAPDELARLRAALALSQAREAELAAALQAQDQLVQGLSRHVPGGLMMLDRLPDGHRRVPYASDGLFTLFDLDPALAQRSEEHTSELQSQ